MEEERGGPVGPLTDLEVLRQDAGMPTARFTQLVGIPERTYRRWQARAKAGHPPKGPWPAPPRDRHREVVRSVVREHPAWGHRKVWAMARHRGHRLSQSTVLHGLAEEGLLLKADYQRERRKLAHARKHLHGQARPTCPNGPGAACVSCALFTTASMTAASRTGAPTPVLTRGTWTAARPREGAPPHARPTRTIHRR